MPQQIMRHDRVRMSEEGARLLDRGISPLKRSHQLDWRARVGTVAYTSPRGVTVLWDGRRTVDTPWPDRMLEKITA